MIKQLKYTSNIFDDIYTKKYIIYKNVKLKSVFLINIIDMFLNKYVVFKIDNMRLNSLILKHIYGSRYNYYIEYLIDNNFIYLYKNYSVGLRSKTFKLTDYSKKHTYSTVTINIPEILNNKIINFNEQIYSIDKNIKNTLIQNLYSVDIDYEKTKEWIDKNIIKNDLSYTSNMNAINKIHKKDIHYVFDKYGRFHTNYTNLKKEIRCNFLTINNNKLKELDIKNSQPFFLYLFMKKNGFTDFNNFDKDVLNGKLYDKFYDICEDKDITRKQIKINIYSILFGRTFNKNKWSIMFKKLYPEVYNWISNYKKENRNYKIIAQELQKLESKFMFNNLIPSVMFSNPNIKFITIHDSIMVEDIYCDEVKIIFINELKKLIKNL